MTRPARASLPFRLVHFAAVQREQYHRYVARLATERNVPVQEIPEADKHALLDAVRDEVFPALLRGKA